MGDRAKILIVDDDGFVRAMLRDTLEDQGYELLEAQDADAALAQVSSERPDLVLLDLLMPGRSGLEILSEISARHAGTRTVVVSSLDSELLVEQALRSGAVGFIVKPFHPLEITQAVADALRG